jgi:hypothetical protein
VFWATLIKIILLLFYREKEKRRERKEKFENKEKREENF